MSKRTRSGSEDIPSIVSELLREVPKQTQTILLVDDSYLKSTASQVEAETAFLDRGNSYKNLNNAKTLLTAILDIRSQDSSQFVLDGVHVEDPAAPERALDVEVPVPQVAIENGATVDVAPSEAAVLRHSSCH